jgi:hypothetical protein
MAVASRAEIGETIYQNINAVAKMSRSVTYDFIEKELGKVISYKRFDAVVDRLINKLRKSKKV